MPRLLLDATWFDRVGPRSWYEREYEAVIVDRSPTLFPDWICVPFNAVVEGEDGDRRRPDLALVDKHYRTWCVVEVELIHHDLYSHVLPQVDAFRTGLYGPEHARELASRDRSLNLDRMLAMMVGERPTVVVVVDSPSEVWRDRIHAHGAQLSIVEPFRDAANRLVLRLNGDQPLPPAAVLTRCARSHRLRRLWRVLSPAALPDEDPLLIDFKSTTTPWHRIQIQDALLLKPDQGDILAGIDYVDLIRHDNGRLAFVPVSTARARRGAHEA